MRHSLSPSLTRPLLSLWLFSHFIALSSSPRVAPLPLCYHQPSFSAARGLTAGFLEIMISPLLLLLPPPSLRLPLFFASTQASVFSISLKHISQHCVFVRCHVDGLCVCFVFFIHVSVACMRLFSPVVTVNEGYLLTRWVRVASHLAGSSLISLIF